MGPLVDAGFDLIANDLSRWEVQLHKASLGQPQHPPSAASATEATNPEAQTIAYYDREADAYVARTVGADMSEVYNRFLVRVAKHGLILDVGSGSGRDLLEFRNRKYEPRGIEPSRELALRARAYSGEECAVANISTIPWKNFDGVWACASLLHIPKAHVAKSLQKLVDALKPGGAIYASLRYGTGPGRSLPDGRYFEDYTTEQVKALFEGQPDLERVELWETKDLANERREDTWINVIATKKQNSAL